MKKKTFAAWLQKQLVDRKWTRSELARAAGVERYNITKWLKGERNPSLLNAKRMVEALGYSAKVLERFGYDIPDETDEPLLIGPQSDMHEICTTLMRNPAYADTVRQVLRVLEGTEAG